MCTYLAHLRICRACGGEDTVLITEQMCAGAEANGGSGYFGSCVEGVSNRHERTSYKCWKCRDAVAVKMRAIHSMCVAAGAAAAGVQVGGGGGGSSSGGSSGGSRRKAGHGHGHKSGRW